MRFMTADGSCLDTSVQDPILAAFGFGRRICPGRFMALDTMWITIASILAVFDIVKAKDEEGKEITPSGEYLEDFLWYARILTTYPISLTQCEFLAHLSYPKPFPCVFRARSPAHQALIEATVLNVPA